ncbi:MAG: tRNA (adenosine(37)-N6)-threonylcarbamoyltransferase complex transferase subunit TsaD [Bacteroidetes bacterium]|nr:MAG: tRNA (adenosine(37)-N6)-threonylcarbamoyltransferase complex transferase subunit TsaD [Bacteroidota bacterium]
MEVVKNNSQLTILGIESSCDDTSAAVLSNGKICSNVVASQDIHKEFGGVVPEWASRKHQLNIVPTVQSALKKADQKLENIDAIACTQGPGLMGSLLVGHSFVKGLALSTKIPFVNVDHIDAHVLAHFIDDDIPELPFLCLLVSGGHTQIVRVDSGYEITVLGRTIDDAAGEAFDKAGKMLGLSYPSGPIIDELSKSGDPLKYQFNTPKVSNLDFSFSGLKTSILYFLQKEIRKDKNFISENKNDLCASIQHTIVSYLMSKLSEAIIKTGITGIGIAGGVAANSELRKALTQLAAKYEGVAYVPRLEYCTDNAAMIAFAGKIKIEKQQFGTLSDVCFTRK